MDFSIVIGVTVSPKLAIRLSGETQFHAQCNCMKRSSYGVTSPVGRGPVVEIRWTDANLRVVEGGVTTIIDAYSSYRRSAGKSQTVDDPGTTAMVSFTVTANWSSGLPLDVIVDLVYVDVEDSVADERGFYPAQWQTGTLRVTAADGTGLTLSPETGDSNTFSVIIDGEPDNPMIFNWADGFQVVCAPKYECG